MAMLNPTLTSVNRSIAGLGDVMGLAHNLHEAYHSLPYAAPPTGARRFAPPEPAKPWNGLRDATAPGPMAPQSASRMFAALGPITGAQDEDCLTLSIWTSRDAADAPVMVWFHGGAFLTGAGGQNWYDGARFAREHGVVVVCVNYRLGALGYLAQPGLSNGNLGLMDQLLALEWVRDHIADFGGDAGNVTVFGQSAGGHAIAMLLACPAAEGLFRRAILQSAPMGLEPSPLDAAAARATRFLEALAQDPRTAAPIDMLAAQEAAAASQRNPRTGDFTPPFVPVAAAPWAGGSAPMWQAAAQGAIQRGVDVMIGWTRDEGALFLALLPDRAMLDAGFLQSMAAGLFGQNAAQAVAAAQDRRQTQDTALLCEEILTDALFRAGSLAMAEAMAQAGGNPFVYRFDYAASSCGLRAAHCVDLPFVFGNLPAWHDAQIMEGSDWHAVDALCKDVMRRWAQFARTGQPGFRSWRPEDRHALLIDGSECRETRVSDPALF